jgi:LacI family transcriptional regulator
MRVARVRVVFGRNPFMGAEVLRGAAIEGESWPRPPEITGFERFAPWPEPDGGVGFILCNTTPEFYEKVVELGWPAVVAFSHFPDQRFPTVQPDETGIGRVACDHLVLKGYRNLAYYGTSDAFSVGRFNGFVQSALRHKRFNSEQELPTLRHTALTMHDLRQVEIAKQFLRTLRPPVGVLCANDELATVLREAAIAIGFNVPDDIGLVGVDNNEVMAAYGRVSISSVDVNGIEIGKLAMRLLSGFSVKPNSLIQSYMPPEGVDTSKSLITERVQPLGVIERKSTDALIVAEPEIASAIRWTREHACEGIDANDVQKHVLVSRRTIDRWFHTTLGRTCSDEIARVRLQRAQSLLAETDLQLSDIASRCGYQYLSHFSHAFRKANHLSPSQWRRKHRKVTD